MNDLSQKNYQESLLTNKIFPENEFVERYKQSFKKNRKKKQGGNKKGRNKEISALEQFNIK